jgi:hypothetical protein
MAWVNVPTVAADTPIVIEWGNAVQNDVQNELLRRDGSIALVSGAFLTLSSATPTADNHAVRKRYADDNFARSTGGLDTFTGQVDINAAAINQVLVLRSQASTSGSPNNVPQMAFWNNNKTTQYAAITGAAANLTLVSNTGGIVITSNVGDIALNSGGGQVRTSDALYTSGGSNRFFGADTNVVNSSAACRVSFYTAASTVDSVGVRSGYAGYNGDGHLRIANQIALGSMFLSANNALVFQNGSTTTPVEQARIDGSDLLIGKASIAIGTAGLELHGATGAIDVTHAASTSSTAGNVRLNRLASADAEVFVEFLRSGVRVGRIEQTGTTGATLTSGSDRRMKTIVGPITDAVERIRAMNPVRVTWNGDAGRGETDAFIADEMQAIVPEAVSGEPDAVAGPPLDENDPPEGTPIMQGMSYDKLVTVTIAALQDAFDEIDTLKARIDALEGAAA